jgi:hypothetical protein
MLVSLTYQLIMVKLWLGRLSEIFTSRVVPAGLWGTLGEELWS